MSVKVVVGSQWGDEGKAKIIDYLTREADIVVRFQGGANAGHTVVAGDQEFVFHLVPSGIMHPGKTCVIGNGVVVDPAALIQEMDDLRAKEISVVGRLFISDRAHVVMPYHKVLDRAREEHKGKNRIGTTGRGIGPCYQDKVGRAGIRIGDLVNVDRIRARLVDHIRENNTLLSKVYDQDPLDEDQVVEECRRFGVHLRPFVADTSMLLNRAVDEGKAVLFEGAQGTLLDIDHGSYPFVTSSNTSAGGACTGAGIGPTKIDEVIGVAKVYTTRVGNGPLPTEFDPAFGERMRVQWGEYGATTGRGRRCGWFDAVVVRTAARINGLSSLALTRLDSLDELEKMLVCVAYRCDGERLDYVPADADRLASCEPVYEEIPGWRTSTAEVRRSEDLPERAQYYVNRIRELTATPVCLISVGRDREQTICVE